MIDKEKEGEIANRLAKMAVEDTRDIGIALARLQTAVSAVVGSHVVRVHRHMQLDFLDMISKTIVENNPVDVVREKLSQLNKMKDMYDMEINQ